MLRSQLLADPNGCFLHDLILESCDRFAHRTALVDTSCDLRLSYGEYGELVERLAKGLISAGLKPGEVIAIFLPNSWEFCVAYHAATLAGAVPTLLNPAYREREVLFQMEDSGAVLLVSDGPQLEGVSLSDVPTLRKVFTTRQPAAGASNFAELLHRGIAPLPKSMSAAGETDRKSVV